MLADLRPRSATEIVDVSVQLFRRHARSLLVVAALAAIPQWLLGIVMSSFVPEMDATTPPEMMAGAMVGFLGMMVIVFAWAFIAFGAIVHSSSAAYLTDSPTEPVPAFRAALSRAWRIIVANFLGLTVASIAAGFVIVVMSIPLALGASLLAQSGTVLVAILTLAVVALSIWFFCAEMGRVMLVTPLVLLEDRGIIDSLRRSRRLSAGFVSRMAALVFITMVISTAISLGAVITGELLLGSNVVSQLVASVLFLPFYPAIACLIVVLYYDLRVRKEGMDLELLAGAPPNSAA
jgi:hypothetical protein